MAHQNDDNNPEPRFGEGARVPARGSDLQLSPSPPGSRPCTDNSPARWLSPAGARTVAAGHTRGPVPLTPGLPLPCVACGKLVIPSYRLEFHDGTWMEIQQGNLPLDGLCSVTCAESLEVEDALRQDGKLTIRTARSRFGNSHATLIQSPAPTMQNTGPTPSSGPHGDTDPTPT